MTKVYENAEEALSGLLASGMTIMAGGWGMCGIPENLIAAISRSPCRDFTVVANDPGSDGFGLDLLLRSHQIRKIIASYVGENREFERQYLAGELTVELVPQGTLLERIRCGGAGIAGFYTHTGAGTIVAEGKSTKVFNGKTYLLETALAAELAIVKAWKGDTSGNLVYRKSARNFNPVVATAGNVTIAEVEELVAVGAIDPDHVHTPGIFIDRIIAGDNYSKHVESRMTRQPGRE